MVIFHCYVSSPEGKWSEAVMILFDGDFPSFLSWLRFPLIPDPLSGNFAHVPDNGAMDGGKGCFAGSPVCFFSKNGRTCHCPRMVHFQKYHNGKHDPFKLSLLFLKDKARWLWVKIIQTFGDCRCPDLFNGKHGEWVSVSIWHDALICVIILK